MSNENKELNELLEKGDASRARRQLMKVAQGYPASMDDELCETRELGNLVQWTTGDNKRFIPASNTKPRLIPGVYEIQHSTSVGLFFEKIPVKTEGLLRFPQTNSDRVVKEIQNFWAKEEIFREYKLTYKRGIILWGPPGCHAAGTKILMFDGTVKKVEDVQVGDTLMGPDSKSREVKFLCRGIDKMYRITPTIGDSFDVNAHHVIYLERSRIRDKHLPETVEVMVKDYLEWSKAKKSAYKLTRKPVVYNDKKDLPVDPYFLGLWLGDGHTSWAAVTTADKAIVDYLSNYAGLFGLHLREDRKLNNKAASYYFVGANVGSDWHNNKLLNLMRSMDLIGNKHIPGNYLCSTVEDRLSLLAGIIDTDGHYSNSCFEKSGWCGSYEILQKNRILAEQIVHLAKSLGFRATCKPVKKSIKSRGFVGLYFRIYIGGDLYKIPTKLIRKQSNRTLATIRKKNVLRCGIKNIELLGDDYYYGFNLSGDHLYLTADFMVHENSGKSCTIQLIMKDVVEREGIVIKFTNPGLFLEGMRVFREIEKETPVVILMEDIDSTLEMWDESQVLNILDGVDQIERAVFLATTNYPERLGARILNRPSRFDKRFKIGHPNAESRLMYFKHLIGEEKIAELNINLKKWVKDTEKFSIAHLKELFVAVVILGDDYKEAVETLSSMKEQIHSEDDKDKFIGFAGDRYGNEEG